MFFDIINIIFYLCNVVFKIIISFIEIWLYLISHILYGVYTVIIYFYYFMNMLYFLILPVLAMLIVLELINRYRYRLIRHKLTDIKRIECDKLEKSTMFTEMHAAAINDYSVFMRKHMVNDNFFDIFTSYYPDGVMNTVRIRDVVRKYMFDLDPVKKSHVEYHRIKKHDDWTKKFIRNTNTPKKDSEPVQQSTDSGFSFDIPMSAIEVHKSINVLTKRFENMYVTDQSNDLNTQMIDWTDLTNVITYKNSFRYLIEFVQYTRFSILMRCTGYRYTDVSSDIRVWIKGPADGNQIVNLVILDDDAKKSILANYRNCSKESSIVYVEIKGFSNYSDLFDVVTCDLLNRYSSIDEITKQFNNVLKMFPKSKINLFASREATIIIPFFINYYNEKIDRIVVINPVYYPYAFHVFFRSVRNKKLDVHFKPNLVRMFNRLSLMDVYFDKNTNDKKFNRLYSRNVHVDFDKDCNLYTNQENLVIVLDMYSHVRIEASVPSQSLDKNITTVEENKLPIGTDTSSGHENIETENTDDNEKESED